MCSGSIMTAPRTEVFPTCCTGWKIEPDGWSSSGDLSWGESLGAVLYRESWEVGIDSMITFGGFCFWRRASAWHLWRELGGAPKTGLEAAGGGSPNFGLSQGGCWVGIGWPSACAHGKSGGASIFWTEGAGESRALLQTIAFRWLLFKERSQEHRAKFFHRITVWLFPLTFPAQMSPCRLHSLLPLQMLY